MYTALRHYLEQLGSSMFSSEKLSRDLANMNSQMFLLKSADEFPPKPCLIRVLSSPPGHSPLSPAPSLTEKRKKERKKERERKFSPNTENTTRTLCSKS